MCTQVKVALTVLIQHNIVNFQQNKHGFVEYTVDVRSLLLHTRFPRYVYSAKTLYGDEAELIVEELLQHGQVSMASVVENVTQRLRQAPQGTQW